MYRVGPSPIGSGPSIGHLNDGIYRVRVKDNNNCVINKNFTLKYEYKNYVADKKNNTNCSDNEASCDGFIKIATKGNKQYTYSWSGPNGFSSTSKDINNLCPGSYNLTATESNGCTEIINVNICCCHANDSQYSECDGTGLQINVAKTVISPKTNTSNDGSISLNATGGLGQYYYKWSGPNGFTSTEKDLINIGIGNYCVTVTDGCQSTNWCLDLKSCGDKNIQASGNVLNTCEGYNYGKITLTVNGQGTAPFSYNWSNGQTTKDIDNLGVGNYCVTVTDAHGCVATNCFNVGTHLEDYEYITIPCGTQYKCNGHNTRFVPSNNYYVTYAGCNIKNYHCALTGGISGFEILPYQYFRANWDQCIIEALCPVSGQWIYYSTGQYVDTYDWVPLPDCNCIACYHFSYCIIGNSYVIYDYRQVNPDYCGPPPGLNESLTPQILQADLRLNEFLYLLSKNNEISANYEVFLPPNVRDTMYSVEYNHILDSLKNSESNLLLVKNINENRLDTLICTSKPCGGISVNDLKERIINNKLSIKPNPFASMITITLDKNEHEIGTITLYDAIGNIVWENGFNNNLKHIEYTLNTSNYPTGIYFVKISGDINAIKKIIKNN